MADPYAPDPMLAGWAQSAGSARKVVQGLESGQMSAAQRQMQMGVGQAQQAMAAQSVSRGSNPLAQRAAMYSGGQMAGQAVAQGGALRAQELLAARQQYQQALGAKAQGELDYGTLKLSQQTQQDQNLIDVYRARKDYEVNAKDWMGMLSDERMKRPVNHVNTADQDEMLRVLGYDEGRSDIARLSNKADALAEGSGNAPTFLYNYENKDTPTRGDSSLENLSRLSNMADLGSHSYAAQGEYRMPQRADMAMETRASDPFYTPGDPNYDQAKSMGRTPGDPMSTYTAPKLEAPQAEAPAQQQTTAASDESGASKWAKGQRIGGGGLISKGIAAIAMLSDEREKKVTTAPDAQKDEAIRAMELRRFNYTKEAQDRFGVGGEKQPGVTAQELERSQLGDEVVDEMPDGTKMINKDKALATALGLIGRLGERLDKLEGSPEGGKRGLSESELRAAENQALDTLHRSEPGGAYQPGSDLAGSGRASVQAPPSAEDNLRRAKEHFAAARSAADDGNHELAARLFQAAQEYSPHPSTAYNASRASQLARGQAERVSEEARASAMYEAEMTRRVQESAALSMPPSNYAPMAGRLAELRQGYQGAMQR